MAAAKQLSGIDGGGGDGFASHIAGMSKKQLHDIMSQMKNQQQARQILIDNPSLTRALFQAQIMLGMVKPPQAVPNVQPTLSQHPQQSSHTSEPTQPLPVQAGSQGQMSSSQPQLPARQQYPSQASVPSSLPPINIQSQVTVSHPLQSAQQSKGSLALPVPNISLPQPSQLHNLPPLPSGPPLNLQSHIPISSQAQQSFQGPSHLHQPLQPPLPQQPRPPSLQHFPHQFHSQMQPNLSFQPTHMPQQLPSQPMFHSGSNQPSGIGTPFPQGQPPLPNMTQQFHQVTSHMGGDFNLQAGTSMQIDRGGPWGPGPQEKGTSGPPLPGPPPLAPGPLGPTGQPSRPSQLTPEMEKALLQQVMSLTPEQINLLPPEQRQQVLHLQQMLR
ncbi:hypothetical protein QJS10_CPA03g00519 [Acorus calamus]|uniref:Cleavage stimulating factor 64 n=1 Tax=Acorus calamus TaxID=4465 RepID=A0AAV9F5A4_ACOCL|nr:hypothetical protein QJS10_CPA03g00519 [Acorus calamus]